METLTNAKEMVLTFLEGLNQHDFEKARNCVTDDLLFAGVMGRRESADAYFSDMKKMLLHYDILRVFANESDVTVWYNITIQGIKVLTAGWYKLENGKIKSIQVVFDPRPLLQ